VLFTNAGTESNENALRICKQYTGRWKFLSMYNSYHGSTFGSSALTGEERRFTAEPGVPGFVPFDGPYPYRAPKQVKFADENDITEYYLGLFEDAVEKEGPDQIAGVFVETIVGSNGVLVPPKGYLPGMKAICEKHGILMVCDEVMAGFYRAGSKFAFHQFDVIPDVITFAKGSTCGYVPLGGVIVNSKIASFFGERKMWNGLTYSAHPMGCAVCCAAMGEYERLGTAEHVKKVGSVLRGILDELTAKHECIGEARSIGLFAQVELVKDRVTKEIPDAQTVAQIAGMLKKEGFATYTHLSGFMVAPPLIISEDELREAMSIFDHVLDSVDAMFKG